MAAHLFGLFVLLISGLEANAGACGSTRGLCNPPPGVYSYRMAVMSLQHVTSWTSCNAYCKHCEGIESGSCELDRKCFDVYRCRCKGGVWPNPMSKVDYYVRYVCHTP